jgi:hypothetical protein
MERGRGVIEKGRVERENEKGGIEEQKHNKIEQINYQ